MRAIWKFLRAIGYLVTGNIDAMRRVLSSKPAVIMATFDSIIEDKKKRLQQYQQAVAGMITQEENKKDQVRKLSSEIAHFEKLKAGAAAKLTPLVQQLKAEGKTDEQIKTHPEYIRCSTAFADFSSTLKEKSERVTGLEQDIKTLSGNLANHKSQMQSLLRDLEKIKAEKHETVAEVLTAQEEKKISDMIAGISVDNTSKDLEEMRDIRKQARAEARVAREVSGNEVKQQEEEFLAYASNTEASSEFDALIGLASQADTSANGSAEKVKISDQ